MLTAKQKYFYVPKSILVCTEGSVSATLNNQVEGRGQRAWGPGRIYQSKIQNPKSKIQNPKSKIQNPKSYDPVTLANTLYVFV
jgi:hypothetical protein